MGYFNCNLQGCSFHLDSSESRAWGLYFIQNVGPGSRVWSKKGGRAIPRVWHGVDFHYGWLADQSCQIAEKQHKMYNLWWKNSYLRGSRRDWWNGPGRTSGLWCKSGKREPLQWRSIWGWRISSSGWCSVSDLLTGPVNNTHCWHFICSSDWVKVYNHNMLTACYCLF